MDSKQLAESVKRLRKLDAQKTRSESHFHDLEIALYSEAIQTIESLVQLVGEMNTRILKYEAMGMLEAAPIAALAKDEK